MTGARLAIHGHFYQPDRRDPFSGRIPKDPTAAPAHDWTERVTDECYAPNAARGNFRRIGWNLGPGLAAWLRTERPEVHASMVGQDDGSNAVAQAYHHSILPLASMRDRRTEIRWGLRDFELRQGRRATGIWLPETAVDLATLRICADEGIRYTILAPWQAGTDGDLDTRRPYRVEVGGNRSIIVMFYDRGLSTAVSFDPGATENADDFVRSRVLPRLAEPLHSGEPPLALVATDGELYGHHQRFRDLFLARITTWYGGGSSDPHLDVAPLGDTIEASARPGLPVMTIRDRTSWSCHHGVLRWSGECPDAADGRWKQPLRLALDRLAAGTDAMTDAMLRPLGIDPWAARDGYVDVASGYATADSYVDRLLAGAVRSGRRTRSLLRDVLAAQSSRLAMFMSDAWFWDDPGRQETLQALRFAAHAARTIDRCAGSRLEQGLVDDLTALHSPATGLDGAALYRLALEQVGQPPPEQAPSLGRPSSPGPGRAR
jgi:Domain of unknown function (DUF3536)/Glycosyl hydrolase family 57